jgi:hypothetical protein
VSAGSIAMPAHTPGPWAWNETGYSLRPVKPTTPIREIFSLEGRARIARDNPVDLDAVEAEDEANLRLIAAAPDLQEALDKCRAFITDGRFDGDEFVANLRKRVFAALAKAGAA